jgi:hybrid cluster-associated redox disulfide protein
MDTNFFPGSQMTVAEVLRQNPEAWVVFKRKHTDCLGCFMQKFCTLQEAAEAHQLPLPELLDDLARHIESQSKAKGAFHENLDQTV